MGLRASRGKVLILTPQAMTGALLGMLVELSQLEPVFADPSERPEDALLHSVSSTLDLAERAIELGADELPLAASQDDLLGPTRGVSIARL